VPYTPVTAFTAFMPYNLGNLDLNQPFQQQQIDTTCSVTGINVATFDLLDTFSQQQLNSLLPVA
jgi:hypothetical protein